MVSHRPNYKIRIVEVGRHLWRYLVQPLSSEQGQLEQVPQDVTWLGFEYLQGGDSTNALDNMFQYFIIFMVKQDFLIFKWDFLYPLSFLHSLDTTEKSQASFSVLPPVRNV